MDDRSCGAVFDAVAAEYDRHRPTYPDALIDRACRAGRLAVGDRVLEVGCGTGQLTRSLLARGLHVTAVEPGRNLVALAQRDVNGPGTAEFVNRPFEDAPLDGEFAAAFAASAFHWVDPDVGWSKMAQSLKPGGLLALIQYCGIRDERTAVDDDALMAALTEAAPELAAEWPPLRDIETLLAGVADRRENVSGVWTWVGTRDVARSYAAPLFRDVEIAVAPTILERTAEELNALLRTLSLYHRLTPSQRQALETANSDIEARLGRPIRSSLVAVLVTARRAEIARLDSTRR
jgi:SAM-dependent methyltransferase